MGIKDVWAIRDCKVIWVGYEADNSAYGNRVYVEFEDGHKLLYGHLDWIAVKAGDNLKKGDVFAEIGSSGYCPSGAHLHTSFFDAWCQLKDLRAKNAVNPAKYFETYGYPCTTLITNPYGSKYFNKTAKTDTGEVSLKWHEGIDFSSWRKRV